jgi:L,D-transpeptidase YcbB
MRLWRLNGSSSMAVVALCTAVMAIHPPKALAASKDPNVSAPTSESVPDSPGTERTNSSSAAADPAIADGLRTVLAGRIDQLVERREDRLALSAFYEARDYAPLWIEAGKPSERMRAAVARLNAAEADGLDPGDYLVPNPDTVSGDPEELAEAELRLMNALLTYARHAQSGRVTPSRISPNIAARPPVPAPETVLKTLAETHHVAAALDAFNPPHEGFLRLRAKLADLRNQQRKPSAAVPEGPLLRPGMSDDRVPQLRKRLGLAASEDPIYDAQLVRAVREFQRAQGLSPDGVVGPKTLQALNDPRGQREKIETILSNMERWRWLPRDLGSAYVLINIPDFTATMVREGQQVFQARVVVGRPETPTPVFSDEIETMQVNPTWHVPRSIIYAEYLPALERDPEALRRMGLIVSRNRDGSISVRQPPGERNALGRLKFNFPNPFQVFLHDTPQRHLFGHRQRANSAGCVRVENPEKLAELLLSIGLPGAGYTAERLRRMYGGSEQWIRLRTFVPIHLVYMNAYVDDAGELVTRPDIYGYDHRVRSALNGRYLAVSERSQRGSLPRNQPPRQVAQERPASQPATRGQARSADRAQRVATHQPGWQWDRRTRAQGHAWERRRSGQMRWDRYSQSWRYVPHPRVVQRHPHFEPGFRFAQ